MDLAIQLAIVGLLAGLIFFLLARRQRDRERRLNDSQQRFKDIRVELGKTRIDLVKPALKYYEGDESVRPVEFKIGGSQTYVDALTTDEWIPPNPIPLDDIHLKLKSTVTPTIKAPRYLLPYQTLSSKFSSYHEAIEKLDKPSLFENRDTFMIAEAEVTGNSYKLIFRVGKYFEFIDTGEALAFELAKTLSESKKREPLFTLGQSDLKKALKYRNLIGNPKNFLGQSGAVGINTLTIFDADSYPRFIMHHRALGKVALAGEMFGVVPAGEFQPAISNGISGWLLTKITNRDFALWRNIMREYNEELLNAPEILYTEDYVNDVPFKELNLAKESNIVIPYFLGLVFDPVNAKPDILTVCLFKENSFSQIFSQVFQKGRQTNAEGDLMLGHNNIGIEFDEEHMEEYVTSRSTYSSGKACLALAWKHRKALMINVKMQE